MKAWGPAILRAALALLFLYAGAAKLFDMDAFARSVESFQLMPVQWAPVVAIALPAVECLSGLGVFFRPTRRAGLLSLFLLTVFFIVALSLAAGRGLNLECGCFAPAAGVASDPRFLVVRDIGLAMAISYAYLVELRRS